MGRSSLSGASTTSSRMDPSVDSEWETQARESIVSIGYVRVRDSRGNLVLDESGKKKSTMLVGRVACG